MTTRLTITPSRTPGRVAWSVDEDESEINLCSGYCYTNNLSREIEHAMADIRKHPGEALPKHHPIYTNWREITTALLASVRTVILALLFIVSTGYAQGTVNLRSCPSTTCSVIATVHEGDVILPAPTANTTGWTLALTPEGQGWIYSDYIQAQP